MTRIGQGEEEEDFGLHQLYDDMNGLQQEQHYRCDLPRFPSVTGHGNGNGNSGVGHRHGHGNGITLGN
jgi:hypothetical protein